MKENNRWKEILQENHEIENAQSLSGAIKDIFKEALQQMIIYEKLILPLMLVINTLKGKIIFFLTVLFFIINDILSPPGDSQCVTI